jgi:CubicO group peptidase (beta-lactamase class C family)
MGRVALIVAGVLVLVLLAAMLVYSPQYVFRVLVWQESDAFDWQKFPFHPLSPSPAPSFFEEAPDPQVALRFGRLAGTGDWEGFLQQHRTQAFLVVRHGKVVYENYFNGTRRDSLVTSFSVAKSFTSTLVGLAIQEGFIRGAEEPVTNYLPELAERDPRFGQITLQHLLLMASGLEYREFRPLLFNSDDPLTTYHPDQRRLALRHTRIVDPPGRYFRYNKYHPQLLGLILERATGMSVTRFLQTRLWDPLGMQYGGSWSTDSRKSGFERMEAGLNARAIDFAKLGVLFLNGGLWEGKQVISRAWVEEATRPRLAGSYGEYYPRRYEALPGRMYYGYMWWGFAREGGGYDFAAEGDKGQFIYVSPRAGLVIVRNGIEYGLPMAEWMRLCYTFAGQY